MRPRQIAEALLSIVLAVGPLRAAEVPRRLADVNQTPASPADGSVAEPSGFVTLGDRTLFSTLGSGYLSSDEGVLWSTDGTASGTRVLSSTLCPFPCQGITPLGTWRGLALLKTATGAPGLPDGTLWRTDGTPAGTLPLAGPFPYDPFGAETTIHPAGNWFFFVACRLEEGCQLFRSDGTQAGTAPFVAAGFTFPFAAPHSFASWQGRLVFVATNDVAQGLWSTDGTPEGTVRLADVGEAEDSQAPVVPTPSRLFFGSGETGEDLWVTDGTPGGARRLADFDPGTCSPPPRTCDIPDVESLTAAGDEVLFETRRPGHGEEIWRSDGTEGGTRPAVELSPPQFWVQPERLPGDRWLFAASVDDTATERLWTADDDFTHAAPLIGCDDGACPEFEGFLSPALPRFFVGRDDLHGQEIWITDGTGAGTHLLADVCPGPCSGFRYRYWVKTPLDQVAGKAWFLAFPHDGDENSGDDELWVTDGTPGGTHRVTGHVTSGLGFLGDLALFGLGGQGRDAAELWATDGTPAGTRQVTILQRLAPGSYPVFLPQEPGGALLQLYDGTRYALWRSDGTPQGTAPLIDLPVDRSFGDTGFIQVGGLRFFNVFFQDKTEIWRTDGTAAGTLRVVKSASPAYVSLATSWRGKLLFVLEQKGTCAFWASDGSPGGTREILAQGPGSRCPTAVRVVGDKFLFVARVGKGRGFVPQIFLSDGTAAGTRQLSQIRYSRPPLDGDNPVTVGGITFFTLYLPHGLETQIWRTDGTGAGTYLAFKALQPAALFGFQGSLYFTATDPETSVRILYRVPAPGAEPVPLAQIDFPVPPDFTPVGDRLFFIASDAEAGAELWVTDGTAAGTRRVRDIRPGTGSSFPESLAAAGERVFFGAEDGEHGRELWESDGTEAGTHIVFDLNLGGFSSNPTNLTVSGGTLFFSADDGETGAEPWALRLEP